MAGKPSGWGGNVAIKDVTFLNTVADVNLFTVTGDVIVRMIAVCKTDLTSAGACTASVGITGEVALLIATTDVTTIDADEVWAAAAPTTKITVMTGIPQAGNVVTSGNAIKLTRSAQIDAGRIVFYCVWTPLSTDGKVVAV
jgi:hypothetical protein